MSMVWAWLLNSLIMAAVLTAGAAALELSARWSGRPARWGWVAALAGTVALPWVLRLVPGRLLPESVPVGVPMLSLDPLTAVGAGAPAGSAWTATELALVLWLAASVAMIAYVTRVVLQLARARRGWRETEVEGGRVYVTRNTGPAALGLRRGMVVVPAWALELDAELRSLLLLHEREHVRSGDPRLLLAGFALVAAMPWNPLVWFQLLRLRNAIELDCDSRVLAGGVDPERYGSLLLEVGRRRGSSPLVMATFAEPRMFLHERITRIAKWPVERRPARAVGFGVLALLLFATALNARDPLRGGVTGRVGTPSAPIATTPAEAIEPAPDAVGTTPNHAVGPAPGGASAVGASEDLMMVSDTPPRPVFVRRTVEPALLNRQEVSRALIANYPPMLRDAGIGGMATVWFLIGADGAVEVMMLNRSSGYEQLDEAALEVAEVMRFSPAYDQERRVAVWIEVPINFRAAGERSDFPITERSRTRGADADVLGRPVGPVRERQAAELEEARARPVRNAPPAEARYIARTVEPEITNRTEVSRELVRNYPPMLRDAGIGGSATVWLHIDTSGTIQQARLGQTSGYEQLDRAALRVAESMEFTPAMNEDEKVAVWIEIPIMFRAR